MERNMSFGNKKEGIWGDGKRKVLMEDFIKV